MTEPLPIPELSEMAKDMLREFDDAVDRMKEATSEASSIAEELRDQEGVEVDTLRPGWAT